MTVKELLDKQYEWTPVILVNEECDCGEHIHACEIHPYIKYLDTYDRICDEYGDREVEYFSCSLDQDNRVIMKIQITKK